MRREKKHARTSMRELKLLIDALPERETETKLFSFLKLLKEVLGDEATPEEFVDACDNVLHLMESGDEDIGEHEIEALYLNIPWFIHRILPEHFFDKIVTLLAAKHI